MIFFLNGLVDLIIVKAYTLLYLILNWRTELIFAYYIHMQTYLHTYYIFLTDIRQAHIQKKCAVGKSLLEVCVRAFPYAVVSTYQSGPRKDNW